MEKFYIKQLKYKKNSMDSGSELSIPDQVTLIKMLRSDDIESARLALSIIDNCPKPSVGINYPYALSPGKYSIVMNYSFFQWVRSAAKFELALPCDDWIKENRKMLERLEKY